MAATGDMYVDSDRGQQWCDAVNQITENVEKIMESVTDVLEELAGSDQGGTIGDMLVKAAGEYLQKFSELVKAFFEAVMKVVDFLDKVSDFVNDLVESFRNIGRLVGISF